MSAYIEFFGADWLFPLSLFVDLGWLFPVSLFVDFCFLTLSPDLGLRDASTEVPSTTGIGNYLSYFLVLAIAGLLERWHLVRRSTFRATQKVLITYVVDRAVAVVVSNVPRGTNLIKNIRMLTSGPAVRTLAEPLEACSSNHFLAPRKISGSAVGIHIVEPLKAPSS